MSSLFTSSSLAFLLPAKSIVLRLQEFTYEYITKNAGNLTIISHTPNPFNAILRDKTAK